MAIIISNSETDILNTCERKWWYGFAMGIRSKYMGEALSYGVLGHKVLEAFYRALHEGATWEKSHMAGKAVLAQYLTNGYANNSYESDNSTAILVSDRFDKYCEEYKNDGWKILAVEETFYESEITDGIDYAMTCDLLVEATKGPYRGEVIPVDHKWTYNFWGDMEVTMHPQLPKYINTLRHNGYPVVRGIINQLRYRQNARQLFQRAVVTPTQEVIDTVRREEILAAKQIEMLTRQGLAGSGTIVRRKLQRTICNMCAYNIICRMEMNGQDSSETILNAYEPNTYGYHR